MAYHNSNDNVIGGSGGSGAGGGGGSLRGIAASEYSGDERDSRSGEERPDSDLNDKPIYLLEHLATFTVNKDSGIIYPADGMRRLLQLEKTTGIWSQKMQLCLDYQWVLIMDYETGNIIERFPASLIQEPTAFTSTDAMELYNNILVFIVSGGSSARSEMHIFQSQNVSAVHLVEDLKNLRNGKLITQQREGALQQQKNSFSGGVQLSSKSLVTSTSMQGRTEQMQQQQHQQQQLQSHHLHHHSGGGVTTTRGSSVDQYGMRMGGIADGVGGGSGETDSEHGALNDETSSTSSDKYERDVTVLNHCFDDIEKFIARLQHAAAASRELERRRRNRKTKKKDPGEGLLTLRTRPPHEKEFIDIFAKFKLSFNLLAKLKAHIHDPNAPELVHFLFTPLALIVEASSDTYYESQLPGRVINPLLTREAINLLINCVTSKETELWRSLGDAWIIPRDQWKEDIGSYHPVFMDGWSPDYLIIDELEAPATPTNINKRHMEASAHMHHPAGIHRYGLNGRIMSGGGAALLGHTTIDEYDGGELNEKYTMHYGGGGEDTTTGTGVIDAGVGVAASNTGDFSTRSEISIDSIERSGSGPHRGSNMNGAVQVISTGIQNMHTRDARGGGGGVGIGTGAGVGSSGVGAVTEYSSGRAHHANDDQILETWLDNLQSTGAKIVLVTYPRTANNDKELSVVRGEYLEILDDTRKWWKARNIRGQVAHVPHTIVTQYNYGDNEPPSSNQYYGQLQQQQQKLNNYKQSRHTAANIMVNDIVEQRTEDNTDWIRNKHLANDSTTIAETYEKGGIGNGAIHDELKHVLRMRERRIDLDIHKTPTIYIEQSSTVTDVANWLRAKDFHHTVIDRLANCDGGNLFAQSTDRLIELCGVKEGRRLISQLKLQKSVSGYRTARTSELQAILARARPKSDIQDLNVLH